MAGFSVRRSDQDNSWTAWMGETFVAGFRTRQDALAWVRDYLTTTHDNGVRRALEEAERRRESDVRVAAMCAAVLEAPPKKGMEN